MVLFRTACFFEGIDAPISHIVYAALVFLDTIDRPTRSLNEIVERVGVDGQTFGQWRNYFLDIVQVSVGKWTFYDYFQPYQLTDI